MKKVCNYRGCHKLTGIRVKYCEEHKFKEKRDFNKYRMKRTDKEEQKFYKSGEWVRNRDVGLCLICLSEKRITRSDVIHHIVELKEDKELRVDENNLIALCNSCHRTIHGKYKKGMVTKVETQKKLRELISKGGGGI